MFNLSITDDGSIYASNAYTPPIHFIYIGQEYVEQVYNLHGLKCLTSLSDVTDGESDLRYLTREWRISYDGNNWTEFIPMYETDFNKTDNPTTFYDEIGSVKLDNTKSPKFWSFGEIINIDTSLSYFVEIRWTRNGSSPNDIITLDSYEVKGVFDRETYYSPIINMIDDSYYYFQSPNIYKVFKLTDFETTFDGITVNRKVNIDYRITQDSGRTWTQWESLTKENLSTLKYTPIRFFNIEYRLKRTGDTTGNVTLYELNLIGDFQNVSLDYTKSNKLGLRDCCCLEYKNIISLGNATQPQTNGANGGPGSRVPGGSDGLLMGNNNCSLPDIYQNPLAYDNINNLLKPYNLGKAVDLYNALSNITTQIFGFDVTYFLTDPDINATDYTFHEYQLYNVVCTSDIKVSVDENNFPDNQITFNQFDMSLFETFEIHITKDVFKKAFGLDRRPSKEDFLWFCTLNRIYQVEHAQAFRDFNNSSVFYKVILKKYTQKSNVKASTSSIEERIKNITDNTTLNELMGVFKEDDKKAVAFKDQQLVLSDDNVRYEFMVPIKREIVDNSSLIVSRDHYDMTGYNITHNAITYKKVDNILHKGDNRSYMAWFKLTNYIMTTQSFTSSLIYATGLTGPGYTQVYTYSTVVNYPYTYSVLNPMTYSFVDNYNEKSNIGYNVNLANNIFNVKLNGVSLNMPVSITGSVWYCYLVNIDQRQKKISQYLYKRDSLVEKDAIKLKTSKLLLLNKLESNFIPQEFDFNNPIYIHGSDMKLTNIRIFNDVIPEDRHTMVLNQYIIRDAQYLILADNANKKVDLPRYPYN